MANRTRTFEEHGREECCNCERMFALSSKYCFPEHRLCGRCIVMCDEETCRNSVGPDEIDNGNAQCDSCDALLCVECKSNGDHSRIMHSA